MLFIDCMNDVGRFLKPREKLNPFHRTRAGADRALTYHRLAMDTEHLLADILEEHKPAFVEGREPGPEVVKRINCFWKEKRDELDKLDRVFGVHKHAWAAQIGALTFDVLAALAVSKFQVHSVPFMTTLFYGGGLGSAYLGVLEARRQERERKPEKLLSRVATRLLTKKPVTGRERVENERLVNAAVSRLRRSAGNREAYVRLLEKKLEPFYEENQ